MYKNNNNISYFENNEISFGTYLRTDSIYNAGKSCPRYAGYVMKFLCIVDFRPLPASRSREADLRKSRLRRLDQFRESLLSAALRWLSMALRKFELLFKAAMKGWGKSIFAPAIQSVHKYVGPKADLKPKYVHPSSPSYQLSIKVARIHMYYLLVLYRRTQGKESMYLRLVRRVKFTLCPLYPGSSCSKAKVFPLLSSRGPSHHDCGKQGRNSLIFSLIY